MIRPMIIGITGGIASGKSEVTRLLGRFNAFIIRADLIGHEVLRERGIIHLLIRCFGKDILTYPEGEVDRRKLGSLVFGDSPQAVARRQMLEAITHPEIRKRIQASIDSVECASQSDCIVLDVPLLFESKWNRVCDEVWFVDASETNRFRRASERGWTKEHFQARESAQWTVEMKKKQSTRIIFNDETMEKLGVVVNDAYQNALATHRERVRTRP